MLFLFLFLLDEKCLELILMFIRGKKEVLSMEKKYNMIKLFFSLFFKYFIDGGYVFDLRILLCGRCCN